MEAAKWYRTAAEAGDASAQYELAGMLTSGKGVAADPKDAIGHFNIGFIRHRRGERREAIEAFKRATALKPLIDRAWYGLGLAHAELGEHASAAEAFERAAQIQPMNPHAWYHLGMAYSALGDSERLDATISHLDRFDPKEALRLARATGREGAPGAA